VVIAAPIDEQAARAERETLQRQVRDHLLLNFTDLSTFQDRDIPILVRGDGCYVIDSNGRRFIDGISGLFCSNLGHGYGAEIGAAAQRQLSELVFTPSWYLTHPGTARLAERLAGLAEPLGLDRVFLTSGGGESVEAAWKLARQWHAARGEPQRRKAIARNLAYHGTSLGALSFTGLAEIRHPFEPLPIPTGFISETDAYRHPAAQSSGGQPAGGQPVDEAAFTRALLAEVEAVIEWEGPDQVAMLIAEPVQNSGGAFTPPAGYWAGLREICDRYGILLVADETITGFGRVGEWFASLRYGIQPDLLTFAKGATAGHAPLGGVLLGPKVAEPFVTGAATYQHGLTFSGHPLATAVAGAALDVYQRENVLGNVQALEPYLRERLQELRRVPLVGDVRGAGFFWAIELVRDRATKDRFSAEDADWLLRGVLSQRLDALGLLCRLDDRGEPVIQLSPPLVADAELLDRMVGIVGEALETASAALSAR
jgi:adenosylmethionine-8-amino-7-oxononanoate aminotransferase